tara:strand:- start:402 stop:560 length:159 start_codon:yes stop_codon:yes gene_type:complete
MAYVALNPVCARIDQHVLNDQFTSVVHRLNVLENSSQHLDDYLASVICSVDA